MADEQPGASSQWKRLIAAFAETWRGDDVAAWQSAVDASPDLPVTIAALDLFAASRILEMNHRNRERQKQIDALEARIVAVEAREYQGTWDASKAYAKGAMVSRSGGTWHSNVHNNRSVPGRSDDWTLACKAGRDGRDGKDAGR
jgi:hypothetical protein